MTVIGIDCFVEESEGDCSGNEISEPETGRSNAETALDRRLIALD